MREEDTAMAGGDKPQPVLMDVSVEVINAPRHIKAAWAVQQVIDNLQLTKSERLCVLKFLLKIEKNEEVPF